MENHENQNNQTVNQADDAILQHGVAEKQKKAIMKIIPIAIAVFILLGVFKSCGGGNSSAENSDGSIKADHWYHNDLVNFQNCVIYQSDAKTDYVFVSYWPVCKECEEHGTLSVAYVTDDERVLKTYTCGDCGEKTTIRIETY